MSYVRELKIIRDHGAHELVSRPLAALKGRDGLE